jgi:hypothetical protein
VRIRKACYPHPCIFDLINLVPIRILSKKELNQNPLLLLVVAYHDRDSN